MRPSYLHYFVKQKPRIREACVWLIDKCYLPCLHVNYKIQMKLIALSILISMCLVHEQS